jgi:predicted phosphodiesterase
VRGSTLALAAPGDAALAAVVCDPIVADLVAGNFDGAILELTTAMPLHQDGKARILAVAAEARRRNVAGVICGHIHHAEIREIDGILYCNDGDWVESCTALVEHADGRLEILHWTEEMVRRTAAATAAAQGQLLAGQA